MNLSSGTLALGINLTTQFLASGGTEPYVYSVQPGGVGGAIDPDTGVYTAPSTPGGDTIIATDDDANTATADILVGTPLQLFCDIIQKELNLQPGRVYLWDQKIMQPEDSGLYIAIGVISCKPFSNINRFNGATGESDQSANFQATLSIDIISRGHEARDRKEEVILALVSDYARTQMAANSFYIAPQSSAFQNLSEVDGAAIPYRFNISVNLLYAARKSQAVPVYDTFSDVDLTTES